MNDSYLGPYFVFWVHCTMLLASNCMDILIIEYFIVVFMLHSWHFNMRPNLQIPKYSRQMSPANIPQYTILYGSLWGMGLVHYGVCRTCPLTVYANIFDNIFGMTVDVNISVMDTLVQAFKTSRPICPLYVLTAWGLYWSTSTEGIVTYIWWQDSGQFPFFQSTPFCRYMH